MEGIGANFNRGFMPKEYEYREGKQAQEDFEKGMKSLFQVPKEDKKKPAKKRAKKMTSERDVSRDSGEDT
jgi:hypothetical protein